MFDLHLLSPAAVALLQVILIDVVLAGDNAVVIGMAASRVPAAQSRNVAQTFVALTQHAGELEWLQSSLASAGQVVAATSGTLEELLAHDAMRVAGKDELAATLAELLRDRGAAVAMGHRAREVFEAQAGATARSVEALRVLLEGGA